MKKKILLMGSALLIFVLATANKNGPGGDHTGAPLLNGNAGTTCATTNCHADGSNRNGSLNVAVTEKGKFTPVTKYKSGTTYTVAVVVSGTFGSKYGFSATVLDPSRAKTGVTDGAASGTKIMNLNSRSIAMQSAPSLLGIFSFDWTPGSTPDSVTIYAAGNAADGLDNKEGDQILTTKKILYFDKTSAVSHTDVSSAFAVYPNPTANFIHFSKKMDFAEILDIQGKIVLTANQAISLDCSNLAKGIYFVRMQNGENTSIEKLVKE